MFDSLVQQYMTTNAAKGQGGLPDGYFASPEYGQIGSIHMPGRPNQESQISQGLYSQLGFTRSPTEYNSTSGEVTTSQALKDWMAEKGYQVGQRPVEGLEDTQDAQVFDRNGQPVGKSLQFGGGPDNAFLMAALAAAGISGLNIAGAAGAGGGGAASAAAGGGGNAAGALGVPAGAGSSAGAIAGQLAGEAGALGGGLGAFEGIPAVGGLAGGGAAGGGLASADLAALFGPAGYGAAASPAELAAAAGGGLGSTLSGLGTKLGSFLGSSQGLSALAGLGGSLLQAGAAGDALDAQTASTDKANALQKYIFDTLRSDNAPLLATRNTALTGLNGLIKDPSTIVNDPGYQFGMNEGVKALDRSAASRGGLYSGATIKGQQRFGNDYAQTKLNDSFGRLTTTAGLGSIGTASNTSAGNNYGNQVVNNLTSLGNATAANSLYTGNVWGNLLSGAASQYKNWATPVGG